MNTYKYFLLIICLLLCYNFSFAQSPSIYGSDGEYLDSYNKNKYDPNSISNPYGIYGSRYSPKSINNPYGKYGSPYSSHSATNPYGKINSPRLYSGDEYLGKVNKNKYDPESISNPYGTYGSPYSPKSVNNQYGTYGSPYSSKSAKNSYGTGEILNNHNKTNDYINPLNLNNRTS
ncbi:MAG: hypothetical protein M1308_19240, partial [Actinobacteria bacterium]|nr:hypothetical protein [Actinomycetota bacterium]